jgi:lysosomal acid lipase/cholesteryl ester hydrolase
MCLSINPDISKKVNLLIGLAPSTKPKGLDNKMVQSLVNTGTELIFLLFGRKTVLSSALFWSSVLTPSTYALAIDFAVYVLCNYI